MRHIHADLMIKFANDTMTELQFRPYGPDWRDIPPGHSPSWNEEVEYRQKPAEPKMVDMWQWAARMVYSKQVTFTNFYVNEAAAIDEVGGGGVILCSIEGSKITVPMVSQ